MITQILADGRAVDRIAHHLTGTEASVVSRVLATRGIHVEPTDPDIDGVVHLWATRPVTTAQEVRALAAFKAISDGPFHFHEAVQ